MTRIIAIDPGSQGGIAYHDGENIKLYKMPDTDGDTANLLSELITTSTPSRLFVYLEKVGGFMGGSSDGGKKNMASAHTMFNFGQGFGFIQGFLMGRMVPVELILPAKWQKDLSISAKGDERKRRLKEKAQQLYPHVEDRITLYNCDALLILHYALSIKP